MTSPTVLVTHALPYANGSIHIGHLLEAILTDIYVRARRLEGDDVVFVSADDTHGTPIEINARKAGVSPAEFVERFAQEHIHDLNAFGVQYDAYHSTNSEENLRWVLRIYERLRTAGHVRRKTIEQLYDPEAKRFLPDRFVKGTCPVCATPDQYGDVCESCGSFYAPTDLVSPTSVLSGATPVLRESEHVFVDIGAFTSFLQEWIDEPGRLQPEVRRFVQTWIDKGLEDWGVSRDAPYFGFEIPDAPGKYFYVWLDAPIGYISATERWSQLMETPSRLEEIWSADSERPAEIVHVIGKDIIYFHTLFWPAMLQVAGLRTPARVHAHGMLTMNGAKMSKARGTFILAQTFAEHLDPTYLRWYFGAKLSDGIDDMDFSTEEFTQRVNAELVNNLANLVSRGASFLHQKLDGRTGAFPDDARPILERAAAKVAEARAAYRAWNPAGGVRAALEIANEGNQLFQERAPWKSIRDDPEEARRVVTLALNLARAAAVLLVPVVPVPCGRILAVLGLDDRPRHFEEALRFDVRDGRTLGPPQRIIERIDPKAMEAVIAASVESGAAAAPSKTKAKNKKEPPPKGTITIDDFSRVELRVGRVEAAERVEGADKLLRLSVDVGDPEPRQIFAGIAQAYQPEELVGRRVAVVANLAPRKMRFGVSEGMVLAAGPGGSDIQLLSVDEGAKPGETIQ
jgi:methionyl-tRNA synthetase